MTLTHELAELLGVSLGTSLYQFTLMDEDGDVMSRICVVATALVYALSNVREHNVLSHDDFDECDMEVIVHILAHKETPTPHYYWRHVTTMSLQEFDPSF